MSTRYSLKALNALRKTTTMQSLNDLPPSIKMAALKDENKSFFEREFARIKENEGKNVIKKQQTFDIKTNKPAMLEFFEGEGEEKLSFDEYKRIRQKLDYTQGYTLEKVTEEYSKLSEISNPAQQRQERKRLDLIFKKLLEESTSNGKELKLYENSSEKIEKEKSIEEVLNSVPQDPLEADMQKVEEIFKKIEFFKNEEMLNNFKKAKEIWNLHFLSERKEMKTLNFQQKKERLKDTTTLTKPQQEVNTLMSKFNEYLNQLVLKLSKEEISL
jgi:hypothetical protein